MDKFKCLKVLLLSILAIIAILTACSPENQKMGEHPLPVEIGESTQADVPIFIESIGNVYSLQTVLIRPQVGGLITEIHVKQGDDVEKDQLLYTIDPRPYQAALDQAKANLIKDEATLKLAEITVERYQELVKQDYVSQLTFDQYKTSVDLGKAQVIIDKAQVELAEINLGYTSIRSPMDGRISQYNIDAGNVVVANDTNALTQVLQTNPADIHFSVTQKEFVQIRKAQQEGSFKFEVYLPEFPEEPRTGNIYFFDNHIDTNTGTILFKGAVPNEDVFFWPGEFVKVRLQLKIAKNAVLVPSAAIQIGQEGKFIYIYQPETSTVEYRLVETGQTFDERTLIEKGAVSGEQVVINGQINLRPNAKVILISHDQAKK